MPPTAPVPTPYVPTTRTQVVAKPHWHTLDFISDLHLQVSQLGTFDAWQSYMAKSTADALFILGDLFEVWVGDDIAGSETDTDSAFARHCRDVLQATAQRMSVYFMPGNRDFLLGTDFAATCHMSLLPDPCTLAFDGQRWLLSHGDALCLADTDYQQFRSQVRTKAWQDHFLAQPLSQRLAFARSLRAQSESRKTVGISYADVDTSEALAWLKAADTSTLIHGHTHHPADHVLDASAKPVLQRLVLSDWDATAHPPRLEVLRLQTGHTPRRVALVP
jgi:UDP-2,3-diacylglucosamine hydrolase